jgi:hypothetical protein
MEIIDYETIGQIYPNAKQILEWTEWMPMQMHDVIHSMDNVMHIYKLLDCHFNWEQKLIQPEK